MDEKLFADPITVQTPSSPILIQPQRTNNILERFFRSLKRANRRIQDRFFKIDHHTHIIWGIFNGIR